LKKPLQTHVMKQELNNMELRPTPQIYGNKDAEPAPKSLEDMFAKWKAEKKPSKIAASFQKIEDLTEEHRKHFAEYDYMWKPMQGGIWGGIWLTDNIPYIHLVLATTPVVEYCLNLKPDRKMNVTIVEEPGPDGPTYRFKETPV
jgi:hypothetical protein